MRLAELPTGDSLPFLMGHDLNDMRIIRALSSYFLATVIVHAQNWILVHEAERFIGRKPHWSANVGLPVEHCDSPTIHVFRETLAVAWEWTVHDAVPSTFDELLTEYERTILSVDMETTDCHPIPEIAAAVQSFIRSREAEPNIYFYFDIGGGTVDGVAFRYCTNQDGERWMNFYSGKVAPLGIEVLVPLLRTAGIASPNDALMKTRDSDVLQALFGKHIQNLVADVVMTAKTKDNPWIKIDNGPGLLPLEPATVPPLSVFIGGGGAVLEWYREKIFSTHRDYQQWNAGVPPYNLREVPRPLDLRMNRLDDSLFHRFAIAYGLSIPYGAALDIGGFPSEFFPFSKPPLLPPRGKSTVDYMDSKDILD